MPDSTENRDQNDYNQGRNFNKTSILKTSVLKSADCYDKSLDSDNDSGCQEEEDRRGKERNWESREGEREEGWMSGKKRN